MWGTGYLVKALLEFFSHRYGRLGNAASCDAPKKTNRYLAQASVSTQREIPQTANPGLARDAGVFANGVWTTNPPVPSKSRVAQTRR